MQTKFITAFAATLLAMPLVATNETGQTVSSPDGQISVAVSCDGGKPVYSVSCGGKTFLEPSPLGMTTNAGDFANGLELTDISEQETIRDEYSLPDIKASHVVYEANRRVFSFTKNGRRAFDLIFQVSNRDVAFKYRLYPQGDTLCCVVDSEATGFRLPAAATTFLCPQSATMGGFARTTPSYETPYAADEPVGKNGLGFGYTFPCLFRNGDDGWILISETGVTSAYCGSCLEGHDGGLYTISFPQASEFNGNGTSSPGIPLPGETPWRTVTLGATLAPIVETTVAFDLVRPLYSPKQEFVYGAGAWSWIIGGDESVSFDEQKRYIDFSAAMGWQSVLIDNWWDKQIGRDGIERLARYAADKGIALFLWYNTNGYWNDAPQTPRNIMNNIIARRREMQWLKDTGVRGIKVDFMGSDKQAAMQLFEEILADANDYGLLVIFHGCTIPRGWERMYPNYVSSEAVLASENLHFAQSFDDNEAFNACLHPFIRNSVGSMDFGGSALNRFYNRENDASHGGGRRVTSDVFELACAVLFQSAVQHFALAPNNLIDAPSWAVDFMKKVPTTWDETRFIDGYPGRYVILARRHGGKWYIAGVNAEKEPLKLPLALPMLAQGETVNVYSDNGKLEGGVKAKVINKKQTVEVEIPCNGAFVITSE
ncbi:MAG: glycoside hydrolase family 97 protein [Prevotella sp.]|nr:glycoside hydrolase family 97 protein [Prevotella sp.]